MKHYFLFAGEASGDLHGSRLMEALKQTEDHVALSGVGGPRMRKAGLECSIEMENFQVMGFSDVLKAFPRLWKLFYKVRDQILKTKPDCVILIDYPGFNLRLARALRKQGYQGKLVHYICPSVWAHGKKRIDCLVENYDLLLTVYPFEATYFSHTPLAVEYIGNPLVEAIQHHSYHASWKEEIGLPPAEHLIALFPGSRRGEIKRHLPLQLAAAAQLKLRHPELQFALSCAQDSLQGEILQFIENGPLKLGKDLYIVPPGYNYELMQGCKTALAKSGTVTLELALHGVPTVVFYELSLLNYAIAKYILRLNLPHYCIVNILGGRAIFPELIGRSISPADLAEQTMLLHYDEAKRQSIKEACDEVKDLLGTKPSPLHATQTIHKLTLC